MISQPSWAIQSTYLGLVASSFVLSAICSIGFPSLWCSYWGHQPPFGLCVGLPTSLLFLLPVQMVHSPWQTGHPIRPPTLATQSLLSVCPHWPWPLYFFRSIFPLINSTIVDQPLRRCLIHSRWFLRNLTSFHHNPPGLLLNGVNNLWFLFVF